MKDDLFKSNGTQSYEEWLRKDRLKVNKKDKYVTNQRKNKNGLDYDLFADNIIAKSFEAAGPAAEIVADVLARSTESDAHSSNGELVAHQVLSLIDNCEDLNFTLKNLDTNYTRALDYEGAESKLYLPEEDDFIIKVQDWSVQSKTPLDYLTDRIILHNLLFQETPYQLYGFGFEEDSNELKFIVTQPFICGRPATLEEIDSYMLSLGFEKKESSYVFNSIEISDLNPRNVLVDENNRIYVIDEIIHTL